jgi:integrase
LDRSSGTNEGRARASGSIARSRDCSARIFAKKKEFIFPADRSGKPLSNMSMSMLLRRMKSDVTVHGFRSSFRDWAGNETHYPREVCENALAHVSGDKTEAAYRRSDALEKRRALMQDWAGYLLGGAARGKDKSSRPRRS